MKKITDLKVEKNIIRQRRNEFGEHIRVKETVKIKRTINTIQGWPRFGHYLLDFLFIMVLTILLVYTGIIKPSEQMFYYNRNGFSFNYDYDFSSYIIFLVYYLVCEATMGRTLGKFATNSYVIDEYANKPDFGKLFIRSISRWIPFNALSCLGKRGWHDQISKTFVVTKNEWDDLKRALAEDDGFTDDLDILDA